MTVSSAPMLNAAERRRSLAAAISAMFIVNLVFFLSPPLMAVVLERHGADPATIGINAAAMACGIFAIGPLAPRWLARFGPARLMRWSLAVSVVIFLLMPLEPDALVWLPLRTILGAAASICWIASEAWINALAVESRRGRLMSIYSMAGYCGQALGPATLVVVGSEGFAPFGVAALLTAIGCFLVSAGGNVRPDLGEPGKTPLARCLFAAPLPMLAVFAQAGAFQAYFSFFPAFGESHDLPLETAFTLLTATSLGGLLLNYLMGWLADRVNRTALAVTWLTLSSAGIVLLPFVVPAGLGALPFFVALGGIMSGTYSLAIVLVGARFRAAELAAATTVFTMMYNAGALAGPAAAGLAIDVVGPIGLIGVMSGLLGLCVPVGLIVLMRRNKP